MLQMVEKIQPTNLSKVSMTLTTRLSLVILDIDEHGPNIYKDTKP
jgi:hypothetical protein